MKKNAIFTICAKNYLAQALTLKESVLKYNPEIDFYLFLADEKTDDICDIDVIELDESWISDWKNRAFKYNVIEFATSIKPFCFKKLFKQEYDKVMYLDPDIYVTHSLDEINNSLNDYSMVLTPHYNHIQTEYTGSVSEEELLFVGIYNLGFCAIKNNEIGNEIVEWWMNRLSNKCFADKEDALHVDQKWIDFLPGFFPNDVFITHHPGINIAIWNLHERKLLAENNAYHIKDLVTGKLYNLLFFHFSGFDPFDKTVINRRHPRFNTEIFPSFIPIINEYSEGVYSKNYPFLSKLKYSFNHFNSNETILPLHRRLYRVYLQNSDSNEDPFFSQSTFYNLLNSNSLIVKGNGPDLNLGIKKENMKGLSKIDMVFNFVMKIFIKLFGIKRYYFLIKYLRSKTRLENQYFLIEKK